MASVFYTPLPVHRMFDLKGSTVGREATREERENNDVMKDNDLTMDAVFISLGKNKQAFVDTIKSDAAWLAEHHIMDYSLLLGIHYGQTKSKGVRTISVQLTDNEIERQKKFWQDASAQSQNK